MASGTNMNTTNGMMDEEEKKIDTNDDETRCSQYHHELVPGFVVTTTQNITKRIAELLCIINKNEYLLANNCTFNLDVAEFVQTAMSSIKPLIEQNTIVQVNSCKKVPQSKHEYKKVARNRLNRNKPKFVGNYVFEPIIFHQIPTFCSGYFPNHSMEVFLSLLQDILSPNSIVRFDQTRAQPLVPYNTFVMDNKFRDSCTALLRHYKLAKEWQTGYKSKANKKKETAKLKWDCFNECLSKLADIVQSDGHKQIIPNNLSFVNNVQFTTTNPIIPTGDNKMDEDNICNKYQYEAVADHGPFIHNQNQQIYDSEMMHYQPQNYCNCQAMPPNACTGYSMPPIPPIIAQNPVLPQFVAPNIAPNVAANNNHSNFNHNVARQPIASNNYQNNANDYMYCGCMDNSNNDNITNANLESNSMVDNNDNADMNDLEFFDEDFGIDDINDIHESPMNSSIFTSSTVHTYKL